MRQLSTALYLLVLSAMVLVGAISAGEDGLNAQPVSVADQQVLAR